MSIVIRDDGSPSFRGPNREEVFACALLRARSGDMEEQALQNVTRWIEMMRGLIEKEEFEQQVMKAAEPRLKAARKFLQRLPNYAIQPAEDVIVEQERQTLRSKESKS